MKIQGKVWGETSEIVANSSLELHRIEVHPDTQCSKHCHRYKWNGFYVESGKMLVRVWQNGDQDGLVDETVLEAGDFTQVKPGKIHQFEGLVIDKGINIQHLKGTLDYFAERFYGPGTKSRILAFNASLKLLVSARVAVNLISSGTSKITTNDGKNPN